MTLGPVQVLVVGFEDGEFKGKIREELERLREQDIVRLVDLVAVRKSEDGTVERLQPGDEMPEGCELLRSSSHSVSRP